MVKDDDGLYRGECGEGLSEEKFEVWVKQQDSDTQVIIVEVAWPEDPSDGNSVTFKVENHADKNGLDLLKQYEESFERAARMTLAARVAQLQREMERAQ